MIKKKFYLTLGFLFFGIGIFGYYMPVVPGTIFMILAAYCFMHSSEKLYDKIVNHPLYGAPIKGYIEKNHISLKSKFIILGSMWAATLCTVYLTPEMRYTSSLTLFDIPIVFNIKVFGIILAIIGSIVVLRAKHK